MQKLLIKFVFFIILFSLANSSTAQSLTIQKIISKINNLKDNINPKLIHFYEKFIQLISGVLNSNKSKISYETFQIQEGDFTYYLFIYHLYRHADDIDVLGMFRIAWRDFRLPMYINFVSNIVEKELIVHYEFFTYNYSIEYPDRAISEDEAYRIAMDYIAKQNNSLMNDKPRTYAFFALLTPNNIITNIPLKPESVLNDTWELSYDPSNGVWVPVYEFYYTSMEAKYEWYVIVAASNGTVLEFVQHPIETYCDSGCQNGNVDADNGSILIPTIVIILASTAPILMYRFIKRRS